MKSVKRLLMVYAVLLVPGLVLAQDPVKVDPSHYKVVFENASVRILRVGYPVGGKSPMHQHPDGFIVPLAAAKVRFTGPDKKSEERDMAADSAMYAPAGSHSTENLGGRIDGILVEFKTAAPGKATIPTSRAGVTLNQLAEGPRGVAFKSTAEPSFQEPAGSKHEYDQVVIALGAAEMSLSVDGKPARTKWARGDVQFIGRGVAHESKNTGGKPIDFVIIAVR
jgi:quercetin dioxygenase-like cupin family protein